MKLSVVMPAYNERDTIAEIVRRVCEIAIDKELIIVDDCSQDGTRDELAKLGLRASGDQVVIAGSSGVQNHLRLLVHDVNQGKGAAVRDGIAAATGELVLIQDADLEYDPHDYHRLLQPILDGKGDVVYGSRFTGSPRRVLYFWHSVGNWILTSLSNMFTNLNLTDMETCYKVFRASFIKGVPIRSNRFGFEPEITAKMARKHARVYEVSISYDGRSYREGKKIGWKDGVAAVWTIVKYAIVSDLGEKEEGHVTLRRMAVLDRYNAWLWEKVAPFVSGKVLEVGAGVGNMTRQICAGTEVVATDADPHYLEVLRRTFDGYSRVRVSELDLGKELPDDIGNGFGTVLCLNVLEHIEDDAAALRRMRDVLTPGGRAVLIVPASSSLYGEIDRSIGHYRRYDRREIVQRMEQAGFTVEDASPFNVVGAFGWYLNGRLLRRTAVPGVQARLYDKLVPLLRLEKRFKPSVGLSLLVVGRRPA
jgi:glycosyltransferase involved in cell wall biosynthesis